MSDPSEFAGVVICRRKKSYKILPTVLRFRLRKVENRDFFEIIMIIDYFLLRLNNFTKPLDFGKILNKNYV